MSSSIIRKVSVSGGTVLRAANNLGDLASASAARTNLGVYSNLEVAALRDGFAPRAGLISAGASVLVQTADNAGLAFGTSDLSLGLWLRLDDWTPSAFRYLVHKYSGSNRGFLLTLGTTGLVAFAIGNGTTNVNYVSTAAVNAPDGAWALLAVTADRDGNVSFYLNGVLLGAAVSIAASSAETLTNPDELTWFSEGVTHTSGALGEAWIINGLLTATHVADIFRAGSIAPFAAGFTFFQYLDVGADTGLQILDRSGNATPQIALRGTSGITHTHPSRVAVIRFTTNTNGNQQLCGASCIDTTKRWRIRSWTINSSGTPTVSLGNVSAGAQYLSGSALTATDNDVTPLTRTPGTANLWCNSNSTATLQHTVILDLVE